MKVSVLDAMALGDTLAEAHGTLGNVRFVHDWDIASAEKAFRRAIELNPNYADGHFFYSDFLISLNRSDAAMAELDRAMQLDPFNVFYQSIIGRGGSHYHYNVSANGERFIAIVPVEDAATTPVQVVLDWMNDDKP